MLWEYKVLENGLNKGKIAMRFVLPSCFITYIRALHSTCTEHRISARFKGQKGYLIQ